ncbi:serine hydrolase [Humidisolicoccus flavus]|uniref:serine hydrolase n=1 Tax=Humidisolicoccus flavus TaxID=3111414 RepID=UPI003255340F
MSSGSSESVPLASVFKLYVLVAVVTAIESGSLAWDDTLTVDDSNRSLPSGELQSEPNGTQVSVLEAATKMIAVSDNTATDMLMQRIGRERVEAAVVEVGHHEPSEIMPVLMTRELFALAWGDRPDLTERWSRGDEAERRSVLDELAEVPFTVAVDDVTAGVVWPEGLDWFASADDVTRVHEHLFAMGARHSEVRSILSENPGLGIAFDHDSWPFIAFKGGSSAGVLTLSWHAESKDGALLTVVVLASSDDDVALMQVQNDLGKLAEDIFRLSS